MPDPTQTIPKDDPSVGRIDPDTGHHFFAGGTFEEQNKMAKPLLDLLSSGKYRDVPGGIVDDFYKGKISLENAVSQVQGTPEYDPSKGRQLDFGYGRKVDAGYASDASPFPSESPLPVGKSAKDRKEVLGESSGPPPEVPYFLFPQAGAGNAPAGPAGPEIPGGFKSSKEVHDAVTKVSTDTSGAGIDTRGKSLSQVISESLNQGTPGKKAAEAGGEVPGLPYSGLGPAPTFDAYQEEQMLRGTYGVDSMTSQLEAIDKQIADLVASEASQFAAIHKETVSSAVMGKKMALVRSSASATKAALVAQRQLITKQISIANKGISMIMAKDKSDYATAKALWNKENNANLKYINAFSQGMTPDQKQEKAALQGTLNRLTPGEKLTDDQKQALDEMVMRAYGYEFTGIENAGLSRLLYSHTVRGADGKNHLMTLSGNPDGTFEIKYTTTVGRATSGLPTPAQTRQMENLTESYFESIVDPTTGFINGADYMNYRKSWTDHGGSTQSFDAKFRHFLSPDDQMLRTSGIGSQSQKVKLQPGNQ